MTTAAFPAVSRNYRHLRVCDIDNCFPISASASTAVETELTVEIDEVEREAIAIELGGVPVSYASEFARLQAYPPAEVPRERWDQFVNDAGLFFDRWGKQAQALG